MPHPTDPAPWYAEHHHVLDFAGVLTAAGTLTTAGEALHYFSDPHRFHPEHALWARCGHPRPTSVDDLAQARALGPTSPQGCQLRRRHHTAAAAWDAFCALLDELDHADRPLLLIPQNHCPPACLTSPTPPLCRVGLG